MTLGPGTLICLEYVCFLLVFGLSASSYNLSFWSKHMNGHAKIVLRRAPLVFLFTYYRARHFSTLIILRRLSKSHQSLNKLSHLYLEVTDDCRLCVPARQSRQSSWWKAAGNQRYSMKKVGTTLSIPQTVLEEEMGEWKLRRHPPSTSPQGPLTMTRFLENSGTRGSCHHLKDRAKQTVQITPSLSHRTGITVHRAPPWCIRRSAAAQLGVQSMACFKIKDL